VPGAEEVDLAVQVPAQGLKDLELKVMDLNAGEDGGRSSAYRSSPPKRVSGSPGGAKCEKRLMMVV